MQPCYSFINRSKITGAKTVTIVENKMQARTRLATKLSSEIMIKITLVNPARPKIMEMMRMKMLVFFSKKTT